METVHPPAGYFEAPDFGDMTDEEIAAEKEEEMALIAESHFPTCGRKTFRDGSTCPECAQIEIEIRQDFALRSRGQ